MKLLEKSPEMALWFGVLSQSVGDVHSQPRRRDLRAAADGNRKVALRWFDSPARGIGSFLWICALLGISAVAFRAQVEQKSFADMLLRARDMLAGGDVTVYESAGDA